MDTNTFLKLLESSPFAEHSAYLLPLIRPAIEIQRGNGSGKLMEGSSRFGGLPDLPATAEWPQHQLSQENAKQYGNPTMPYRFLAQFNCRDLRVVETGLPESGLLSFFVKYDAEGLLDFFWREDDYIRVIYSPDDSLAQLAAPEGVDITPSTAISLSATIDIPFDRHQRDDWPFEWKELDEYYRSLRDDCHRTGDYLLGYPSHCSLGYNPLPSPEWISLLSIGSDDDWCWHDDDRLMVFIETRSLAGKDFSNVRSDAG